MFDKSVRNRKREWGKEPEFEWILVKIFGMRVWAVEFGCRQKLTAILLLCLRIDNVHIQSIKHKWFGCRVCVCHHLKSNKCWWLLMWWFVFGKHAAYRLVSNHKIYFYSQFRFIFICRHIWAFGFVSQWIRMVQWSLYHVIF